MEPQQLIPYIKKEAIMPIEISAGFLQRLREVSAGILIMQDPIEVRQFTEEELPKAKDMLSFEGWKAHYITLSVLLNTLERKAEELQLIEFK